MVEGGWGGLSLWMRHHEVFLLITTPLLGLWGSRGDPQSTWVLLEIHQRDIVPTATVPITLPNLSSQLCAFKEEQIEGEEEVPNKKKKSLVWNAWWKISCYSWRRRRVGHKGKFSVWAHYEPGYFLMLTTERVHVQRKSTVCTLQFDSTPLFE